MTVPKEKLYERERLKLLCPFLLPILVWLLQQQQQKRIIGEKNCHPKSDHAKSKEWHSFVFVMTMIHFSWRSWLEQTLSSEFFCSFLANHFLFCFMESCEWLKRRTSQRLFSLFWAEVLKFGANTIFGWGGVEKNARKVTIFFKKKLRFYL